MIRKLISTILILTFALQNTNAFALRPRSTEQTKSVSDSMTGAMHAATGQNASKPPEQWREGDIIRENISGKEYPILGTPLKEIGPGKVKRVLVIGPKVVTLSEAKANWTFVREKETTPAMDIVKAMDGRRIKMRDGKETFTVSAKIDETRERNRSTAGKTKIDIEIKKEGEAAATPMHVMGFDIKADWVEGVWINLRRRPDYDLRHNGLGPELAKIFANALPAGTWVYTALEYEETRRQLLKDYYVGSDGMVRKRGNDLIVVNKKPDKVKTGEISLESVIATTTIGRMMQNAGFGDFNLFKGTGREAGLKRFRGLETLKWALKNPEEGMVPLFFISFVKNGDKITGAMHESKDMDKELRQKELEAMLSAGDANKVLNQLLEQGDARMIRAVLEYCADKKIETGLALKLDERMSKLRVRTAISVLDSLVRDKEWLLAWEAMKTYKIKNIKHPVLDKIKEVFNTMSLESYADVTKDTKSRAADIAMKKAIELRWLRNKLIELASDLEVQEDTLSEFDIENGLSPYRAAISRLIELLKGLKRSKPTVNIIKDINLIHAAIDRSAPILDSIAKIQNKEDFVATKKVETIITLLAQAKKLCEEIILTSGSQAKPSGRITGAMHEATVPDIQGFLSEKTHKIELKFVKGGSLYGPTPLDILPVIFDKLNDNLKGLSGKKLLDFGAGDLRIPLFAATKRGMRAVAVEDDPEISQQGQKIYDDARASGIIKDGELKFTGNTDAFSVGWEDFDVVFFYYTEPLLEIDLDEFRGKFKQKMKEMKKPSAMAFLFLSVYDDAKESFKDVEAIYPSREYDIINNGTHYYLKLFLCGEINKKAFARALVGKDAKSQDRSAVFIYSSEVLKNQGILNIVSAVAEGIKDKKDSRVILAAAQGQEQKLARERAKLTQEQQDKILVVPEGQLKSVLAGLSGLDRIYYKAQYEPDLPDAVNIMITPLILESLGKILKSGSQFEELKREIINLLQA